MARAKKDLQKNLKLVDAVFVMLDARIPASSNNPSITSRLGDKIVYVLLSKADLADAQHTKTWIKWFEANGIEAMPVDLISGRGMKAVISSLSSILEKKLLSKRKSLRRTLPRCMVVGIPNVGKSMFINKMAGSKPARTGQYPGVTRGPQWISISDKLEMLDMPGILWPKLEDRDQAMKLAATGAIKKEVFDPGEVSQWLLEWFVCNKPDLIKGHFGIDEVYPGTEQLAELIGKKRGFLTAGGNVDGLRTADHILKEFKEGKLGRITLETPNEKERTSRASGKTGQPAQL
ncbi:MAG: Ribosome biogenesis GTPase A [Desulfotomaculum sp. 46_80]|nr:MAG: Ribosome biogenesis GTPase A [Desulfotomaculum sp. 46_80]